MKVSEELEQLLKKLHLKRENMAAHPSACHER